MIVISVSIRLLSRCCSWLTQSLLAAILLGLIQDFQRASLLSVLLRCRRKWSSAGLVYAVSALLQKAFV